MSVGTGARPAREQGGERACPRVLAGRSGTRTKMLESSAVASLLEGLTYKKCEVRAAPAFALGVSFVPSPPLTAYHRSYSNKHP